MSSDAYVRRIETLYQLNADLQHRTGELNSSLRMLAQAVPQTESRLRSAYYRVEDKVNQCRAELEYAEREYYDYCNYTEPENFSHGMASQLEACVERARMKLDQAEKDLIQAERLLNQGIQVICSVRQMADSAAGRLNAESDSIVHAVEQAAYELTNYAGG